MTRWILLAGLLLPSLVHVSAQGQVASGPEPGAAVPALNVVMATGEQAEKPVELASARRDGAQVFAIVQNEHWGRPLARWLRKLDEDLAAKQVKAVAVWFADDPEPLKAHLPRVQTSLKFSRTDLAVFEGQKLGPNDWKLNDAAPLTVVVAKDGKVVKSFVFDDFENVNTSDVLKALGTP